MEAEHGESVAGPLESLDNGVLFRHHGLPPRGVGRLARDRDHSVIGSVEVRAEPDAAVEDKPFGDRILPLEDGRESSFRMIAIEEIEVAPRPSFECGEEDPAAIQ